MEPREFDLVVWGATGFTGRLVAAHLLKHHGKDLGQRWALGGRNREKLARVREALGPEAAHVPLVVADGLDAASIDPLVQRTAVVCTTVGPYAKYGEPLVQACARHGTHYCDLTGEVPWMRRMIDRYSVAAQTSGARLVHCCGFDSIPSDLGCWLLQETALSRFGQPCEEVKLGVGRIRGGVSGGTVASLLHVLEEAQRDPEVWRTVVDPYALLPVGQRIGPSSPDQMEARWDADFDAWTGPFMMAMINTRVVHRTNALLQFRYGREFLYSECQLTGRGALGWTLAASLAAIMNSGMLVLRRRTPRRFCEQWLFPRPGSGPSEAVRNGGSFEIWLVGKKNRGSGPSLRFRVTGNADPGYACTSRMLAESAMCLARDHELPETTGGFWTPASCFGNPIVTRLEKYAGIRFSLA